MMLNQCQRVIIVVTLIIEFIKLSNQLVVGMYNKKLFTKHEELYTYNIELGLKVLDFISENESSEVLKSVTNQLNMN